MKSILNRLMLVAFAAVVAVSATGCPADDPGTNPDLTVVVTGDMAAANHDLTHKD